MHYIKFTKSQAMPIFRHCARQNENYSNENIDPSRTKLNYNLAPADNQWGRMQDRLKQLTFREQKNNIVLCGWVVTAPANLPEEKQRQFFKIMYDFMAKKYGENNVVSAYVHKDEAGPGHMHFLFVPATPDNKLSASKTTNRSVMQRIHEEAQQEIDKYFNHQYLLRADNPEDRAKKRSPKIEVFKQALNALETQNEIAKIDNDFMREKIKNQNRIIDKNNQIIQENSARAQQAHKLAQKLPELEQRISALSQQEQVLKNDIKGLQGIIEDYKDLLGQAAIHGEIAQQELKIAVLRGNISNEMMEQLQQEIEYGNAANDILNFLEGLENEIDEPEL